MMGGLPVRISGIQHIGLTVPDMEEAVAFFTRIFGAVCVMECGSVDVDDEFMIRRLGVPSGRRIKDQRVIRLGNGGNLELFEYSGEPDQTPVKQNSEIGACHFALEVKDAVEATERLRAAGVDVLDGPTLITSGPMEGLTWVYLRSPWGQFLELVSTTGPMGYEKSDGPRMWSPSE
jgi:catechol 2,3-dioxygenase-like lactoylglutathione lyase family enzyme